MAVVETEHSSAIKESPYLSASMPFSTATSRLHLSHTCPKTSHPLVKKRITSPLNNDKDRALAWLEAMKNLSPARARHLKTDLLNNSNCDAAESQFMSWMTKHPSALDNFNEITQAAAGKQVAVFLDYDGTLSPIVEDPERAFMSDEMRTVVKEVASLFPTSIITGRSREKVYEFVKLPELFYAGSHGMDIMGPAQSHNGTTAHGIRARDEKGNEMVLFQPASNFTSIMNEVFQSLEYCTQNIPGAKVEHNKFCISVHFRCVKEENWLPLAQQVQSILSKYEGLHLTQGRKILEIRPKIEWNKGKALDYLLRSLGLGNRNNVFPIYIGDDRTDEDAFKVVRRYKFGLDILVSNVPKETNARCSLRDPTEVLEFLRHLVRWKRRRMSRMI